MPEEIDNTHCQSNINNTYRSAQQIIEFKIANDDRIFQIKSKQTLRFGKSELTFPTPHIGGMLFYSAEKKILDAQNIYNHNILSLITGSTCFDLDDFQIQNMYDYLETIQVAIITLYAAIEASVNKLIPLDYLYIEEQHGGTLAMDKDFIERNKSTSFKLAIVLPEALEIK